MALFAKSLDTFKAGIDKAGVKVTDWAAKAAATHAEAAELDANSGLLILADESAAEGVSLRIQTLERKARAFDQATVAARTELMAAYQSYMEAEAVYEDGEAKTSEKDLDKHRAKIVALTDQLRDLEGIEYAPFEGAAPILPTSVAARTRSRELSQEVRAHQVRAAMIRYFLKTGMLAREAFAVNQELGTRIEDTNYTFAFEGIQTPNSVVVANAAGWAPEQAVEA